MKSYLIVLVTSLVFVVGTSKAYAHNPPYPGKTDCGIIQGGVFYSEYYTPGNPNGTPAVVGSCSWVQTSTTKCDDYKYNGITYRLYPHKYTCNLPLDDGDYMLILSAGFIGFFRLRYRANSKLK